LVERPQSTLVQADKVGDRLEHPRPATFRR
jgi:hypothetical protein